MASTWYPKYYFYIGGSSSLTGVRPVFAERIIDFATQPIVVGDSAAMVSVAKNSVIHTAGYQTIATVTSASSSFAIGSASLTFCTATTAVAAGSYGARPTISATNTNVLMSADDDIFIKTVTVADLTVGQLKVFAQVTYPELVPSYSDADGNTKTYTYTDRNSWTSTKPVIP